MPPRNAAAEHLTANAPNAAPNTAIRRAHQQDVVHRLRRVEGQIRGVLSMIERDASCDAVAQQLSAARKALDRAFYEMMACSLEMELCRSPEDERTRDMIAEKTRLLAKYA